MRLITECLLLGVALQRGKDGKWSWRFDQTRKAPIDGSVPKIIDLLPGIMRKMALL